MCFTVKGTFDWWISPHSKFYCCGDSQNLWEDIPSIFGNLTSFGMQGPWDVEWCWVISTVGRRHLTCLFTVFVMSPFVSPFVPSARTKEIVSNAFIMFSNISRQKRIPLHKPSAHCVYQMWKSPKVVGGYVFQSFSTIGPASSVHGSQDIEWSLPSEKVKIINRLSPSANVFHTEKTIWCFDGHPPINNVEGSHSWHVLLWEPTPPSPH